MPNREIANKTQVVHLGNSALTGTTPDASDWVDTRGADAVTFVIVNNSVVDAGTAAGVSFEVQEGDTTAAAQATAVADADLTALESTLAVTSDGADDAIGGIIGYVGNKRYARIEATGTTGTNADFSVVAILQYLNQTATDAGIGASVAAT